MQKISAALLLFIMIISFSSCSAIEGIFKAGVWVGVVVVVLVVALIIFIIGKSRK